jgi:hypothetical protein
VPAQADGIAPDGQGKKPCPIKDFVAWQGRESLPHPEVCLLQGDDIRLQRSDPVQHPPRIAAQVSAKSGPDIPGRKAQAGL